MSLLLLLGLGTGQVAANAAGAASPTGAAAPADCSSLPAAPAGAVGAVSVINAGGPGLCGYWQADTLEAAAGIGGKAENWVGRNSKCQQQAPLCTVRYGNEFSYTVPTTRGASYRLRLTFTEVWWLAPGKRVFDVLVDGQVKLAGLDPFALGGGEFEPVMRELDVSAAGETMQLTFRAVTDNAAVASIEVFEMAPTAAAAAAATPEGAAAQRKLQAVGAGTAAGEGTHQMQEPKFGGAAAAAATTPAAASTSILEGQQQGTGVHDEDESEPPSITDTYDPSLLVPEEVAAAHGLVHPDGTCTSDDVTCGGTFRSSGRQAADGAFRANDHTHKPVAAAAPGGPAPGTQAAHLMDGAAAASTTSDDSNTVTDVSSGVRATVVAQPLVLVLVALALLLL